MSSVAINLWAAAIYRSNRLFESDRSTFSLIIVHRMRSIRLARIDQYTAYTTVSMSNFLVAYEGDSITNFFLFASENKLEMSENVARTIIKNDESLDRLNIPLPKIVLLRNRRYEDIITWCYRSLIGKTSMEALLK